MHLDKTLHSIAIPSALALAATLALGCAAEPDLPSLGNDALAVHRSDLAYMTSLVKNNGGQTIRLDLSDDIQYRFIQARIAASGKTRANSPQFFQVLDGIRDRHVMARKSGKAKTTKAEMGQDHLISDYVILTDNATFEGSAFSTVEGGSDYTFVDIVVWDENWNQIGDYGWAEDYMAGKSLVARSYGDKPVTSDYIVKLDSFELIDVGGVQESTYTQADAGPPMAGEQQQPQDINGDGVITVCLNRNHSDCDYPQIGQLVVSFPMQGWIRFPWPVISIVNDMEKTQAKLSKADDGGTQTMENTTFAPNVFVDPSDPSNRTVFWNIPRADAVFSGDLFKRLEEVNFLTRVTVNVQRGPMPVEVSAFISSVASDNNLDLVPMMRMRYSCLARGTEIRMADGSTMKVEDIGKGAEVRTDAGGLAFGVTDVSIGEENIPMVRIRDDAGHTLLLTESHPIVTADRGIVWAANLAVGDKVETESGPSELVLVEREMFGGSVHNLKLDKGADPAAAAIEGSTMYANGFLVGDLAMQSAYEFKHDSDESAVIDRLPVEWHADYENRIEPSRRAAR